jgi:sigma-B regulation protein RsbU (phosphoserine phosphatase)
MDALTEATSDIVKLLSHVPLLASLTDAQRAQLAASLQRVSFPQDAVLFREGEHGDTFYIVMSGRLAVHKAFGSTDQRLLAERGPGEFIGEMSLLNPDGLRTATVIAQTDIALLELRRANFDALLNHHPAMAYDMLRVQSARLTESHAAAVRDLHEKNLRLTQAYQDLQAAQEKLIAQEALARELRLAAEIQASILPTPETIPRAPDFAVSARMIPAEQVGGDFFDAFWLGADRIGLAVGDVSGKGMPAALFMALTSSLLRAEARRGGGPGEVAQRVNAHLCERNPAGMFATLIYAEFDVRTRELAWARAGHPLPLLRNGAGDWVNVPQASSLPIGLYEAALPDVQMLTLSPDALWMTYSDGVTEAMNAGHDLFDEARLRDAVQSAPTADDACRAVLDAVAAFRGDAPQSDDLTVLALICQ